jgi:hypothetical protein
MDASNLKVRDARDRMIHLLGLGTPYPLRDLGLKYPAMVALDQPAEIHILGGQAGVRYQVCDEDGNPIVDEQGNPFEVLSEASQDEEEVILLTPKIVKDITFTILALRQGSGAARLETYLSQIVSIKAGIDTVLPVTFRPTERQISLQRRIIVNYGEPIRVAIEDSQEGVSYGLVTEPNHDTVSAVVKGDLGEIVLESEPFTEDIHLKVKGYRTADPQEATYLDTPLAVTVRPNPVRRASVDPEPIIDFKQTATVKISETQRSAKYRLFIHPIRDQEFVHRSTTGLEVIKVSVENKPDAQIRRPAREMVWTTPEGYTPWGEAQPGTGGDLQFKLSGLTNDSLVIVQAEKSETVSDTPQPSQTAIQLEQAAVILVRPDPTPPLRVKVLLEGAETSGEIQVFDGQPGVFYYFRLQPDDDDLSLSLPAYFHQRDDRDERYNKGVGQLKLGVDFVIAPPLPPDKARGNLAQLVPESPWLEIGSLPADTVLHVRAVKAQTQVAIPLNQTAQISAPPDASPEKAVVDYGGKTKIRIKQSRAKAWYQLWVAGKPLADLVKGTGKDRLLDTGELTANTTFELLMRTGAEGDIVVEQVLELTVAVLSEAEAG